MKMTNICKKRMTQPKNSGIIIYKITVTVCFGKTASAASFKTCSKSFKEYPL